MESQSFDNQLDGLLAKMNVSLEDIETLSERIFKPIAKPSDFGFSARELHYWLDKKLLDFPKSDDRQRAWCRLNLIEVIWIKLVREYRKFHIPFGVIAKIKHQLFFSYFSDFLNNMDEIKKSIRQATKNEAIENIIQFIESNPEVISQHEEYKMYDSLICAMLVDILLKGSKIVLHTYIIDDTPYFDFEGYSLKKGDLGEAYALKHQSRLSINMNELIANYLIDVKFERLNQDFGVISDTELEILKALRNNEIKELHITKDQKNVISYTTVSRRTLKDADVFFLKRTLRMNEYDEVRIVLRNGKDMFLESKSNKKIRPSNPGSMSNNS